MAVDAAQVVAVQPVERPLNLIPVGLKEAALDSPTFRATALHFSEQIDSVERWLDGYVRSTSRLASEISPVETAINSFLAHAAPPPQVSEAALDHDYTLLAVQRHAKGAREFWQTILRSLKRYDTLVADPIKAFLQNELRSFKDARRTLETSQRSFDSVISRYMAQNKSKEASSLREDAFQLHEARKAYLKASMDYCLTAPQVRASLDRLIVRVFTDQWREMQNCREANASLFTTSSADIERVRGWSREMENSERAFKRELTTARQQIEETALSMTKPSRDMDDYATSNMSFFGAAFGAKSSDKAEKQGWLFLRTVSGKPARTVWSRRWFYVKNGIFGWLVQGQRSGGVEESEKTGVLLCGVRPSPQEERRFCFEVKTKDTSIILQAETQLDLTEWINAFELAKRKALDNPSSSETASSAQGVDPAFSITAAVAPEFAARPGEGNLSEESSSGISVPESSASSSQARPNTETGNPRRVMSLEKEKDADGSRDHAARIIQKLDLHKRSNNTASQHAPSSSVSGGIASLISASHNVLPVGPGPNGIEKRGASEPGSSLAPSTLASPPAPTNLSHTAVLVSSERGISIGQVDGAGTPSGLMANLWGSSNWGHVNRLGDAVKVEADATTLVSGDSVPASLTVSQDDLGVMDGMAHSELPGGSPPGPNAASLGHRKTISVGNDRLLSSEKPAETIPATEFPDSYPLSLRAQQAQFRMLFPDVPLSEKVVMVFRASWNPNEQQEFPGRVYVTVNEIYFYSNHLGLVLITGASLRNISEVTAATGRDCDFLYLHLKDRSRDDDLRRITVKIFLEPLRLLQRRFNYLVRNASSSQPESLEHVLSTLIKMETEPLKRSSSVESWEDVTYDGDDAMLDESNPRDAGQVRRARNLKASLRIDGALYTDPARTGREIQKFKLPSQPVLYTPQGMQAGLTRDFNLSAKALFHVIFGDKSAVFQLLYANRSSDKFVQSAWTKTPDGTHWTRWFSIQGKDGSPVDKQTIDIMNDHLCYSVTNIKTPWRLPYADRFSPMTKIVITHTAKSRCKLAIFQQVAWQRSPSLTYVKGLVERHALNSLEADALDLTNVAMDQVAKLGSHSKTNRAIEIFGSVGQLTQVPQIDAAAALAVAAAAKTTRPRGERLVSLPRLVFDDVVFRFLGVFGWTLDVIVALGKAALNVCTAHTLLVVLLATSILYNSWHGYRESLTWYNDRRASNFMLRMGVRPEPVLSKAVYLADLELMSLQPSSSIVTGWNDTTTAPNTCSSVFQEQLTVADGSPNMFKSTNARLHRSRDSLARSRHDLLVALRVVNRVERDVVTAAWEDHLRAEEKRCSTVTAMLQRTHAGGKNGSVNVSDELSPELAEYCESCHRELEESNSARSGARLV